MKLSSVVRLYRIRLRARVAQELFAVMGIAVGVGLLFSSQVASTSLNGSVRQLTAGIVGQMRFQIAARGPQGFDQALLAEVQRLPGVDAVVPVLEERVSILGPGGARAVDLLGTDPRYAQLAGPLVRRLGYARLSSVHAIAVPAPVAQAIGVTSLHPVEMQIGERLPTALLGTTLTSADVGALVDSPIALGPLRYVQSLTGMTGRLSRIFVRSRPGEDRLVMRGLLRLAAGALNVRPANFEATEFAQAAGPTNQSTVLFSAISALVGFLFAFNAMLLTVSQRRRLVEDLRLDGYTAGMITRVLLFDALVLGVMASLVGLALGDVLSLELFNASPGYLSLGFPVGSQRIVTLQSVALAVGGGMAAACAGVLLPLRREIFLPLASAFSRRPRSTAMKPGSLMVGLVCVVLTSAILFAAPQAAIAGIVSLVVALLLLLPAALTAIVAVFDRLRRSFSGVAAYLAVIELRSRANRARALAIGATGAIAVFGSVAIQGAHQNLQSGLDRLAHDLNLAPVLWVSPAGAENALTTTAFHRANAAALARLGGVREVRLYRGSFLDIGDRRVWVIAPPRNEAQMIPPGQVVKGDAAVAGARIRQGGWIAMSQAVAAEHNLRVGQAFTLPTPVPLTVRLAAITTNFGWPPGAVVINAAAYASAWRSVDPSAYQVALRPGSSQASVRRELELALGPRSALTVQSSTDREARFRATSRQGLVRLQQISTLVLIAAVLAMGAAMGGMIWQRRPQLADMQVDGFGRRVLWRALLLESALLLGSGCSIGALFGIYGELLLSHALAAVTGFPVVFSAGVLVAIKSFVIVTAVAVTIVAVPGYLAARVRAAISLQE
jgi:putative ABC transport system permease protein